MFKSRQLAQPVKSCAAILHDAGLSPVLADVGSSGVAHKIWEPIARESLLLGFDPDTRNPNKAFGEGYGGKILVSKAVAPDDNVDTVSFVLTEYPSCSSMLEPDLESLASFSFRDYFKPVNRESVPATSINRVIEAEGLEGIHWIKLDSQGADLRILQSISAGNFRRLLAVDIEPGLIKAYKNEDMFTDCHAWLIENGFWMSRLEYQAYPKLRPETLADLADRVGIEPDVLIRRLPKAPTAVEGRYLREIDWLRSSAQEKGALIMAGVFGLVDGHRGYACDVASLYAELFGSDGDAENLMEAAVDGIG